VTNRLAHVLEQTIDTLAAAQVGLTSEQANLQTDYLLDGMESLDYDPKI
jgi:hypothetical protein